MIILIKMFIFIKFIMIFIREILIANVRVARDVITPGFRAQPGVIAIDIACKTDMQITLLVIVISLTPGTLVLDVSHNKKKIFIHAMFSNEQDKLIAEIKKYFEKPIVRLLS